MNILLVEDDLFLREVFTEALQDSQVLVTPAEDGQTAYDKLVSNVFDVVLLDVFLPDMSGIDIVSKLTPLKNKNLPRILFLTNSDDPQVTQSIKDFGLTYIIKSDITPDQLVIIVSEFYEKVVIPQSIEI